MSGGKFNYSQSHILNIAEDIQKELDRQGKEKDKEDLWCDKEYYKKYPEERFYPVYPESVQQTMCEAILQLKKAFAYAHNIDYFLSGDNCDEEFNNLKEELDEIEKEHNINQ